VLPIYLTFDDGPDPDWTPQVLDLLAQAQMQATFFAIGRQVQRVPALARRIVAAGHALGNHTYSHRHPWLLTPAAARREVRDGAAALSDATGQAPRWFRPPHGRRRACMSEEAQRQGERVVMWDLSAVDWGPLGARAQIERRLACVRANHIVLMHDGRNRRNRPDQLLQALPSVLDGLLQRQLHSLSLPPQ
jgi:peptidoglycan/xylan/chitin deacetylase (PgdA/CDA1 family)